MKNIGNAWTFYTDEESLNSVTCSFRTFLWTYYEPSTVLVTEDTEMSKSFS